jgi:hypothetical protein
LEKDILLYNQGNLIPRTIDTTDFGGYIDNAVYIGN